MTKYRFSDRFYRYVWKLCGYDRNIIDLVCEIINDEMRALKTDNPEIAVTNLIKTGRAWVTFEK